MATVARGFQGLSWTDLAARIEQHERHYHRVCRVGMGPSRSKSGKLLLCVWVETVCASGFNHDIERRDYTFYPSKQYTSVPECVHALLVRLERSIEAQAELEQTALPFE